jgi:membrane associated rhomboid family serine protease
METPSTSMTQTAGARRRNRLLVVAAVVLAALGLWALMDLALGIDLRSPASFGEYGTTSKVGPANVAIVSAIAVLAAWGLLAALERLTPRARRVWLVIAVLVLVGSLGGPLSGSGLTTANRMELVGFHLLVGAVLIPLLYRTSPKRPASPRRARDQLPRTEQTGTQGTAR